LRFWRNQQLNSENLKVKASRVKELLGSPTWYLWKKAKKELGVRTTAINFTASEVRLIVGWFSLYRSSAKDRSPEDCIKEYYRCLGPAPEGVMGVMSGDEVLALKNRPSVATLYRRGFRKWRCYNPEELNILLRR
jgi:hypothetical protein